MVGFRNICCILLIIYIIFVALAVLIVVGMVFVIMQYAKIEQEALDMGLTTEEDSNITSMVLAFFSGMSPIDAIFEGVAPLAMDIYFFVCINSLYHEVKELNESQVPGDNIFVIQQQQLVRIDNICGPQPPPYNPAMQPACSTQVVIPMQPMYPDECKIKPQAV